jgi:Low-density lipoprotein receptor domain class A.
VDISKVCDGKPDCPNGADEGESCDFDECEHQGGLCSNKCMQTPLASSDTAYCLDIYPKIISLATVFCINRCQ